ncbi:hypothetical protein PGB90_005927 [Kerria lacca]
MNLKFCANLSFMFQESASLLERYALAKECGFVAVECAFPYDYSIAEVKMAKEKENLEQVLINTYPGNFSNGELGFAAIPDKQTEFRNSIKQAVLYAGALNCKKIHIMAGRVGSPTNINDEVYLSNLQYAADIFEKEGITGLIEPINPLSVPNYYLNSFEKALSFIHKINKTNLMLQLDVFHLQLISGNLTNNINKWLPIIGHIQIAQAPNRNEPDTDGEINFCYIFDLLKKLKYSGWIGLEYTPLTDTKSGLKWMDILAK